MEYNKFGPTGPRRDSNISDLEVDVSDTEHCILCFNNLYFFATGKCGHKNICHTCALRLRLIIKDPKCPICKTELTDLVIAQDKSLTFDIFDKELRDKLAYDKEDPQIFYEHGRVKAACLKLRSL
jgi:hypothetical protein